MPAVPYFAAVTVEAAAQDRCPAASQSASLVRLAVSRFSAFRAVVEADCRRASRPHTHLRTRRTPSRPEPEIAAAATETASPRRIGERRERTGY